MKVNVLTEIIRKVVREEVKKEIRSALKLKSKKRKSTAENVVSETSSYAQLMNEEVKPSKKVNKRTFTTNKALNDILNETVGGVPQDASLQPNNSQTEYKNLMDKEMFGTGDMASIIGGGQPNIAAQTVGNTGARPTPELQNVFNKDYRSVLKAMDKKAKEKRG